MLQNFDFIDCQKIVNSLEELTLKERITWVPVDLEYNATGCYAYSCVVGGEYFSLVEGHLVGSEIGSTGFQDRHIAHCDQTRELTEAIENATNTKAGVALAAWAFRGQGCPGIRCQRLEIVFPTTATYFMGMETISSDGIYLAPPLELILHQQLLGKFGNWPRKMMVDVDIERSPLDFTFCVQLVEVIDGDGRYQSGEARLRLRVADFKDEQGNWPDKLSVGLRPL